MREIGNWGVEKSGFRAAAGSFLILVLVGGLVGGAALPGPPRLVIGESVAADFEVLARQTWDRFLDLFWARRDCFGDVHLEAAYGLNSRAGYDPGTATATVRVPGTAAMLQSGLIHEWAHHVEFQCEAHAELRPAFLAAQGLPPGTPWRPPGTATEVAAGAWAGIPSEQYAEAVIALVLGGRPIPTAAHVSPAAVGVVDRWARGEVPEAAAQARGE